MKFRKKVIKTSIARMSMQSEYLIKPAKVDICKECPLYDAEFVPSCGNTEASMMIVGDAPNWEEASNKELFSGTIAGPLDDAFAQLGIDRSDVYFASALKCRIPRELAGKKTGKEVTKALDTCRMRLRAEVKRLAPKVILGFGDLALRAMTGKSGITARRGEPAELHHEFADLQVPPTVIPTFHPNYILNGQEQARPIMIQDIKRAYGIVHGEDTTTRHPVKYHYCTTFGEALLLLDKLEKHQRIAYDSETTGYSKEIGEVVFSALNYLESKIFCMSFSFKMYEAWVLPWYRYEMERQWTPSQRKILKKRLIRIFEDPTKHWVIQNAPFDLRFLYKWGVDIRKMRYTDLIVKQAIANENVRRNLDTIALMHTDLGNYKRRYHKAAAEAKKAGEE